MRQSPRSSRAVRQEGLLLMNMLEVSDPSPSRRLVAQDLLGIRSL